MHETIDWLYSLQHFGIKLGLDNIRALLDLLERPDLRFRSIHVAGTNGKGSVAAMADSMLRASGVRCGLFTSPHLVRPNERIRIDGEDIPDDELHRRLERMRHRIDTAVGQGTLPSHPSFFEVVTATALEAFSDHTLDAAVLEVGLGGRLDATNAVDADVGIIVSIGRDHTKTLGATLDQISTEKAGIVKPRMPLVSGVVQQSAVDTIRETCRRCGAHWIDARVAVKLVEEGPRGITFVSTGHTYPGVKLALAGRHQIDNARVALAAYEILMQRIGRPPDPAAVRRGLASVRWAGRLQWITPPEGGPRLLLDGAHNPAGIDALSSYLRTTCTHRPVLVFGATSGKPLDRMLPPLARHAGTIVITRPPVERGLDPEEVATVARPLFERVETAAEPAEALETARTIAAAAESFILVSGSLYLVGHILGLLAREDVPGPVSM